ncbi:hypothetical protein ACTWPF_02580 [Oceanobacillus sp. M65]|uniref:hypothetical protein n=1 Tax=Oceanobacillus sp. M65 TaxID=3457435 RepID=UPI003FCD90A6
MYEKLAGHPDQNAATVNQIIISFVSQHKHLYYQYPTLSLNKTGFTFPRKRYKKMEQRSLAK